MSDGGARIEDGFLREVADAVPLILWTQDADGRPTYFNRRWAEYTGHTPGLEAGGFLDFVHPDDRERVVASFAAARTSSDPFAVTYRLRDRHGTYRAHEARVVPVKTSTGAVGRWVGTAIDVDDRERASEEQRRLATASAVLGTSLELERTLADVAALLVPRLADWCSIDLVGDQGELRRAAVAHVDPEKVELAWRLWRLHPPDPEAPYGVTAVIRTRRAELLEVTDAMLVQAVKDPEILDLVRGLGLRSSITVPLLARDRVLGAISLVTTAESEKIYTARDVGFAEELARRISIALDNARLYEEATRARAAAEAIASDVQEQCKLIESELVRIRSERDQIRDELEASRTKRSS